jgi:hypothetical protein
VWSHSAFSGERHVDVIRLPLISFEIFDESHAVGLAHVGAEGMAAIAGADQRRIDQAILAKAGDIRDEAELDRVVFARAEGKRLRPLLRRAQQVIERRNRTVVEIGSRRPDAEQRSRRVWPVGRLGVEQSVAPDDRLASVQVLDIARSSVIPAAVNALRLMRSTAVWTTAAKLLPSNAAPGLTPAQSFSNSDCSAVNDFLGTVRGPISGTGQEIRGAAVGSVPTCARSKPRR